MGHAETIAAIKAAVAAGTYRFGPHAFEHMLAEGFDENDVIAACRSKLSVVEEYTDGRVLTLGHYPAGRRTRMPLHMVCEFVRIGGVDFVTIYIPSRPEWDSPTQRRR